MIMDVKQRFVTEWVKPRIWEILRKWTVENVDVLADDGVGFACVDHILDEPDALDESDESDESCELQVGCRRGEHAGRCHLKR